MRVKLISMIRNGKFSPFIGRVCMRLSLKSAVVFLAEEKRAYSLFICVGCARRVVW